MKRKRSHPWTGQQFIMRDGLGLVQQQSLNLLESPCRAATFMRGETSEPFFHFIIGKSDEPPLKRQKSTRMERFEEPQCIQSPTDFVDWTPEFNFFEQEAPLLEVPILQLPDHAKEALFSEEAPFFEKEDEEMKEIQELEKKFFGPVHPESEEMVDSTFHNDKMTISSLRKNARLKLHGQDHSLIWRGGKTLVVTLDVGESVEAPQIALYYKQDGEWLPSPFDIASTATIKTSNDGAEIRFSGKFKLKEMSARSKFNNTIYKIDILMNKFQSGAKACRASIKFLVDNNKTYQKGIHKVCSIGCLDSGLISIQPGVQNFKYNDNIHMSIGRVQ